MGACLSVAQRNVYLSFVGVLAVNKIRFSKGQLKQFLRKLFLHFPDTTPETVTEVRYWDSVISKFTELATSGDGKAAKYLFWSQKIKSVVEKINGVEKESSQRESFCFPRFPEASPQSRSQLPQKHPQGCSGHILARQPWPLQDDEIPPPRSDKAVCLGFSIQPWPGC